MLYLDQEKKATCNRMWSMHLARYPRSHIETVDSIKHRNDRRSGGTAVVFHPRSACAKSLRSTRTKSCLRTDAVGAACKRISTCSCPEAATTSCVVGWSVGWLVVRYFCDLRFPRPCQAALNDNAGGVLVRLECVIGAAS